MKAALRVLVTRPAEQAAEVCAQLAAAGFEAVCLPAIAVRPLEDPAAADALLAGVERYDWIVFPSANAARCLLDRLRARGRPPAPGAHAQMVAGPATAAVLAEHGLAAALVPQPFGAEAALRALTPRVRPGARVLLPRGEGGGGALAAGLRALGAVVDEVVLYRTEPVAGSLDPAVVNDLVAGEFCAVVFFSPSAVRGFAAALDASGVAAGDRARVVTACIGPTTAAAAAAAGWRAPLVASDTTAAALVAALAAHVQKTAVASGSR